MLCGFSTPLRKHALKDPKLTLKDILIIGRQSERREQQTAEIEHSFRNDNSRSDTSALNALHQTRINEKPQSAPPEGARANHGHIKRGNVQQEAKSVVSVFSTTILHEYIVPYGKPNMSKVTSLEIGC